MKVWLVGSLLGLAMLVDGLPGAVRAEDSKEAVWLTDYAAAKAAGRRTGQPLQIGRAHV